jgi:hypothetical protein
VEETDWLTTTLRPLYTLVRGTESKWGRQGEEGGGGEEKEEEKEEEGLEEEGGGEGGGGKEGEGG